MRTRKAITHIVRIALVAGVTLVLIGVAQAATTGNIDPNNKWAWGTNVGWINFNPTDGGVTVYSDHLEGYVWGENIGWIRLGTHTAGSPHTYANTSNTNYGVNNDGNGNLSGYAWGTNVGWINFNPSNGGVTIDPTTGDFAGYAWGENVGWINFSGTAQDSTAYKVNTGWSSAPTPTAIVRAVGGFGEPLGTLELLAPWIALIAAAAVGTVGAALLRRRWTA